MIWKTFFQRAIAITTIYRFVRYLVIYPLLFRSFTPVAAFVLLTMPYSVGAVKREEIAIASKIPKSKRTILV